jgi:hypothetical protein
MRLIKMSGLAALAAVASMAFASSAMAGNTALCTKYEEPCAAANLVKSMHMELTAGTGWKLKGSNPHLLLLCLKVLVSSTIGGLGNPQEFRANLTYEECGTNSAHNNCTVTETQGFSGTVLREALNLGTLKANAANAGAMLVKCLGIHCEYDLAGLAFAMIGAGGEAGNGMVNLAGTKLAKHIGSLLLCPATSEITEGLPEPLSATYVMT